LIVSKIIDSYLTYKISQNKTFLKHNEIDFNEILNYDELSSLNRMYGELSTRFYLLGEVFVSGLAYFNNFFH
jgi:hypothetical protein